jgi:hypothetical protein
MLDTYCGQPMKYGQEKLWAVVRTVLVTFNSQSLNSLAYNLTLLSLCATVLCSFMPWNRKELELSEHWLPQRLKQSKWTAFLPLLPFTQA